MTAPQERPVAGDGLDREAIERRAEMERRYAADVLALLAALRAAEERIADLEQGDAVVLENARLRDDLRAAEAENERHRKANLVRAVVRHAEGKNHDGWVADLINAECFDPVPWRIAETFIEKAKAAEAEVERLRTLLGHVVEVHGSVGTSELVAMRAALRPDGGAQ